MPLKHDGRIENGFIRNMVEFQSKKTLGRFAVDQCDFT